jgi:hypothetical protein
MGELRDRLWRVPGIRCSMAMAWKFVHDKPVSYAAWYLQQEKGPHSAWSLESGLIRREQDLDENGEARRALPSRADETRCLCDHAQYTPLGGAEIL